VKFDFKGLPGTSGDDYARPVVPVTVEGLTRAPQLCLLDTGALSNRFGAWVARAAGLSLEEASPEILVIGGFRTEARTIPVQLALGGIAWEAPVSFCEPWPLGFPLLGQEGFFRWFKVSIRAARLTVEVVPEEI
jgi:hypothetical protein